MEHLSRHARRGQPGGSPLACVLALVAMMVSTLAGCGSSNRPLGKTLRIALYGNLGDTDPARASTPSAQFLDSLIYSGLVKFGPDLHIIPELAVSLPTISNDGRTYTFTVRQDARFADGQPCTAADVAYSLARALSPRLNSAQAPYYLGNIAGATAVELGEKKSLSGLHVVDRLTVRIRLAQPDASFLDKLALPVADVVERPRSGTGGVDLSGRLVGAGPWTLAQRQRDGTLVLAPRRHYYGNALQIKSLILKPVSSDDRAMQLYRKSALDVVRVPPGQYGSLLSRSDFHQSPALDAYYALPSANGIALAASLDRGMLIHDSLPELSPLKVIVPPAVPDYVSSAPNIVAPASGDPTSHTSIALQVDPPGDQTGQGLRRALAHQWPVARREGIRVVLLHASTAIPDPALWLALLWSRTRSTWYHSTLLYAEGLTNDPVNRMSTYSALESWALQNGLIIPLASGSIAYLINPRVQNVQVTPAGIMPENNNWSQASVAQR